MKNDYIKQALVLEIERFKIFLTLTTVTFGTLLSLIQNQKNPSDHYLILFVIFLFATLLGFSIKTHYDIETLMRRFKWDYYVWNNYNNDCIRHGYWGISFYDVYLR